MSSQPKIALHIPDGNREDKYLALRLKSQLSNERCEYVEPSKMLIVSNVKGSFQVLYRILLKAKVIDQNYRWTFDDGHLIILGDCMDDSKEFVECLWLIYALEDRAKRKGGYVHYILGDCEMRNLNGKWKYNHPMYANTKHLQSFSYAALYDGNGELWRWLRTKNVIEKIGDIIFVHGSISNNILDVSFNIGSLNDMTREFYKKSQTLFEDKVLSGFFFDFGGSWPREHQFSHVSGDIELIRAALKKFKAHTIITGHAIEERISSYFNGKVICVGVAQSMLRAEALLIEGRHFYRLSTEDRKEPFNIS